MYKQVPAFFYAFYSRIHPLFHRVTTLTPLLFCLPAYYPTHYLCTAKKLKR